MKRRGVVKHFLLKTWKHKWKWRHLEESKAIVMERARLAANGCGEEGCGVRSKS